MNDKEILKKPLSGREYGALRSFFGVVSTLAIAEDNLKERVKLIPNGWRNWRLVESVSYKLLQDLMYTLPLNKLKQIQTELAHTRCYVEVRREYCNPAIDPDEKMMTYIPQRPFERIMAIAVNSECLFCDKTGKAAKRCPLRADLNAVYHFELEKELEEIGRGGECPFAGWRIDENE